MIPPRPIDNAVHALREASHVTRCHTIPHHGTYTVGQHSFDMLTLLFLLYPGGAPSLALVKAVVYHDFAERWTGDVPAAAKLSDGNLAKRIDLTEQKVLRTIGAHVEIEPEDRVWLNALDKLELYLWATDQIHLGNSNLQPLIADLREFFCTVPTPVAVVRFVEGHIWTRTSDHFPQSAKPT